MVDFEKVLELVTELVIQESEETGKTYIECIEGSVKEACIRLGVSTDEVYKGIEQ